ncbi:MAG: hypothetical protein ABEN55_07620 [Bradymonadaceae bacterium]
MRPFADRDIHLGYCTNIHAATGWPQVLAALRQHAPRLKDRLAPDGPMGLGLRLSAAETSALAEPNRRISTRSSSKARTDRSIGTRI